MASILSDEFDVETAHDGMAALKYLLRARPDVVATDIVMPELDGIEFLKSLRSTPSMRLIPVLLISGHSPDTFRVEGFEQGADGYLAKPYTERELRVRLRTLVQTARERAEASRREAFEQAERDATAERAAILESITDPFYALDHLFRFTYLNERAVEYFGKPRAELLGRSFWDLFPQTVGSVFEKEYRRAMRNRRPCELEALSPISDRWLDVHVYPTPRGLAINFRDITARKEVERALRDSEAARSAGEARHREAALRDAVRVRLVDALRPLRDATEIEATATRILGEHLQCFRVIYASISGDGEYAQVQANYISAGEEIIGRHRLDDFGAALMEGLRKGRSFAIDDVGQDERLDAAAKANTLALNVRAHVLAPVMSGHRLVATLAVHEKVPRKWGSEEIAYIQEFAERIFAALERVRNEAEIREANRRKDEFLATLAHELRNPLAPMSSAAHVLRNPHLDDTHARQAREIIERQIHHMVRLVDDLLDVSRINVGQINLRNEIVSLSTLVNDAVEAARPAIEDGEHTLEVNLPEKSALLEGDGTRLVQVFQNLLHNAAKYTPAGGHIRVAAETIGSEAVVTVRDNGLGIALEAQERIFELFTRIHPRDSIKVSGLGIGLSLARRLVELHQGRIEVRSEGINQGSEFTVFLPLLSRPPQFAPDLPAPTHAEATIYRVLVIDDNRDAADSLQMLLATEGFETRVAYDGAQGLAEFNRYRPDIVLLDIGMPLMDGYEVARQIRSSEFGSRPTLCAVTGWGQAEDKRKALESGFDEHLTKPIDPNSLTGALIAAVRRRGRTTSNA